MKRMKILSLVLLGLFLACGLAIAQVPTGRIIGTVVDDQGTALPGVSVDATSPRMVGKATAITETKGVYRLFALPPGTYTLTYALTGFKTFIRKDIFVRVEETITVDVTLTPGALEEEVTVIGQSPLIDVKSTSRGMTLTKDIFSILPKGRNFDSLTTTVPGVQNEALNAGMSVDGASGAENMFYVDGTAISSVKYGTLGENVSFDFAEEVQFKASGYSAEYGGSLGGVVNVITQSGGNEFHGSLLGYYYGTSLQTKQRDVMDLDFSDNSKAKYYSYNAYNGITTDDTVEMGFNLGGYIIKDRIWFFGSFLPQFFLRDRTLDFALLGTGTAKNSYTRNETYWNGAFKLTAQPISNLRLGASFVSNFYKYKGENASTASASSSTDYNIYGYSFPNYSVSGYADLGLGNNFLFSVRGGWWMTDQNNMLAPVATTPYFAFRAEQPYSYAYTDASPYQALMGSLYHNSGWQNFPRASVLKNVQQIRNRASVGADANYFFDLGGEHSVKAGVVWTRQVENVDNSGKQYVVYLGWNMDFEAYGTNYGRGAYGWYGVRGNNDSGPYGDFYDVHSDRWAIFLQDSWTIGNKLTVNYGVRAESEFLPGYATTDPIYAGMKAFDFPFSKKISPRFGAIYDVFGDSSLKIYGSFGIFQDVMKMDVGANAFGGFKWKSAYYTLDDWDYTKIGAGGVFPGTLLKVLDFRAPSFDAVDPDIKPMTQREISFGAEKKLMENWSLSLRVVNKDLIYAIDDTAVVLPDGEYYYYTNVGSDFLNKKYDEYIAAGILEPGTPYMPKAKRLYWAVNLALDKRFSNNWLGGFSYTWSQLTGNYGGLASSDETGRVSPNGERYFDLWYLARDKSLKPIDGVLPTDRTHIFKLYGSYVFDFGLTVGAIFNAMSGTPVTEEWNVDAPGYYPYNRGNLGRTPFLWFANLYSEYNIKVGKFNINFNVNVDNLFDVKTAQRIYQIEYISNISPGDAAIVANSWSVPASATLDPRYKMQQTFYPPLSVRLGMRIGF
ncbi:MAG: TonB-dependent receptor [Candidatus Aminicenantales bacterium]